LELTQILASSWKKLSILERDKKEKHINVERVKGGQDIFLQWGRGGSNSTYWKNNQSKETSCENLKQIWQRGSAKMPKVGDLKEGRLVGGFKGKRKDYRQNDHGGSDFL